LQSVVSQNVKIFALVAFALSAFALNSVLCRMALGFDEADPAGFTLVRLASGAIAMSVILAASRKKDHFFICGKWKSAFFLFAYAFAFSFAYLGLSAATGALILFGSVQLTMLVATKFRGEGVRPSEWFGLLLAISGLIYLVLPGLHKPPLFNFILMVIAGISWGIYTLIGQSSSEPLADTAGNFVRSLTFILISSLFFIHEINLSLRGWILAVASGAVGSGLGYAIWYAALPHISAAKAATLQLAVPLIAAFGGIVFLGETLSARLVFASALILGGIGITIYDRLQMAE
jgi:drug/metabolite transporter (DMT)-like permease